MWILVLQHIIKFLNYHHSQYQIDKSESSKKITIHPKLPQLSILGQKSPSYVLIFIHMVKGSCEHIFTIPIRRHGHHLKVKTSVINRPPLDFFQGHSNFLKLIKQISQNTIITGRCTTSFAELWNCGPCGGWFDRILPLLPLIHHTLLAIVGHYLSVITILLLCVKIIVWLSKVACGHIFNDYNGQLIIHLYPLVQKLGMLNMLL